MWRDVEKSKKTNDFPINKAKSKTRLLVFQDLPLIPDWVLKGMYIKQGRLQKWNFSMPRVLFYFYLDFKRNLYKTMPHAKVELQDFKIPVMDLEKPTSKTRILEFQDSFLLSQKAVKQFVSSKATSKTRIPGFQDFCSTPNWITPGNCIKQIRLPDYNSKIQDAPLLSNNIRKALI